MAIKRIPITRVVIIEGAQPNAWTAKVYDSSGNLRSGITTGSTREYVERKIAEWFPGVPVEYRSHTSKRDPTMKKLVKTHDTENSSKASNHPQLWLKLQRMLEARAFAMYTAERKGKSKTWRWNPDAFQREAIKTLGRGSSEDIAALIHSYELSPYLGVTKVKTRRDPISRRASSVSGRRELYRRAMQMPALAEWNMFHDPMSDGRRHGYSILFEDRKYVIEPLYSNRGLFLGYGLSFSPGTRGLHARINRDGLNEIAFNGWVPEYRRPQEAAAVARRFAEREGYA